MPWTTRGAVRELTRTDMTADDVREALRRKIELRWSEYQAELLQFPAAELFSRAGEIAAAQFCHEQLTEYLDCYAIEDLEYLLRFDDPLTVVRDQWMAEQNVDLSDEFSHALWILRDQQSAEQDCPKPVGPSLC